MPDELPAWWTWLIFSIQWYFWSATASKPPISPIAANDGFSLRERLDRRAGADELVLVEDDLVVEVLDRDDGARRSSRLGLRARRRAPASGRRTRRRPRGDQPSTVAIRSAPMPCGHEAGVVVGLGVHRPGAAVGAHRDARHRLDAAGEDEVLPAGGDLLRGDVDGLEARGAEAVELDAGDGVRQAGLDGGGLGDVAALVADGRDAAEDDVVDRVGIELVVARRGSRASGRRRGRPA